jgi:hypothetical protein
MKTLAILFLLAIAAHALPPKKITNRELEDGTGTSKEVDPDKRQSVEIVYDAARKPRYKIVYQLDERLQPLSGIYYNNAGKVFQKSAYKVDGSDRIVQEVVYDAADRLVCTKNYIYGTRGGRSKVIGVDVYDANGQLMKSGNKTVPAGGKKK